MQAISLFKTHYIIIAFFCFAFSNAQTAASIKEIKDNYQTCLNQADFMLGCSYDYYNKADSLLNVVYNKVRIRLKPDQREQFRKEQLKWLKKRDARFKKIRKRNLGEGGLVRDDQKMMVADEQAEFIFQRVEELMKRL